MNYLEQIVAFYRWKEVNPLPASAIALWHEMMAVCNKAGWPEEFTVPNVVLQSNAGLSRKEFDRARQLLIENGSVQYKKSNRVNNAGKYKLIPRLSKKYIERDNGKDNERDNGKDNERDNFKELNKDFDLKKELKDSSGSSGDDPFRLFLESGFGQISPIIMDQINDFIKDYGESWTCEAMREAVLQSKRNLKYVNAILMRWKSTGIDDPWNKPKESEIKPLRKHNQNRTSSGKPKLEVYRNPTNPHVMSYEDHRDGELISAQLDKMAPPTEEESKKSYRAYQLVMGVDGVISEKEIEEAKRKMRDFAKPKELVTHE